MAVLGRLERLEHQGLPGVHVRPFTQEISSGKPQEVLVEVEPNAVIPLHKHSVDAEMIIVAGEGFLLSDDETNGQPVSGGDLVFFQKNRAHGFEAGETGLIFISRNGGIVDKDADRWDIEF